VVTTETVRRKVKNELKGLLEIQRGLAEMAVQLAASWTEEYRVRTAGDWRANLNSDVHLWDMLKECLDFMVVMVEVGEDLLDHMVPQVLVVEEEQPQL
jgi:hypothetical protein